MTHAVLPARGRTLEVWEVVQDPCIDILDGQGSLRTVLNGHEDEAREREGRLRRRVDLRTDNVPLSLRALHHASPSLKDNKKVNESKGNIQAVLRCPYVLTSVSMSGLNVTLALMLALLVHL